MEQKMQILELKRDYLNVVFTIFLGIVLLGICSQLIIPIKPVPITMQTAGLLIIGLLFPKKEAIAAVVGYTVLGSLGVPLFVKFGSGLSYLTGISGGYYFGFILSVYLMTTLRQKITNQNLKSQIFIALIGTAAVFVVAIPWLALMIGFSKSIQVGLLPFILPGILKASFVAGVVALYNRSRGV